MVINHEAERMIYEKMKITEIQKELTDYAIEKYKAKEKEKNDVVFFKEHKEQWLDELVNFCLKI